jgi:hypothetical protein
MIVTLRESLQSCDNWTVEQLVQRCRRWGHKMEVELVGCRDWGSICFDGA